MKLFRLVSTLYFILLSSHFLLGQQISTKRLGLSAGYHRGFLIAHRPTIVPLQQEHINGIEFDIFKRTDGSKQWHTIYKMPETGISLSVWDLGNQEQLGIGIAAIPYIDFPIEWGTKYSFDLKFGWGIGYVEKIFDADVNYKNVAIGSHFNCALVLQPHYSLRVNENLNVGAGLSITHFSNGSVVTPNLGLNLASITGGVVYNFGKKITPIVNELPSFKKSTHFTIFGAGAIKQTYPANGNNYFAGAISADWIRQKTYKSGFGGGADLFYDRSIYKKLEEMDETLNNKFELFRAGIHGSYELVLSDFSFMIGMGGYLYSRLSSDGTFYHRIAMRYQFSEKMFACVNLKAHWGKADCIEWGLGYRINYKTRHE